MGDLNSGNAHLTAQIICSVLLAVVQMKNARSTPGVAEKLRFCWVAVSNPGRAKSSMLYNVAFNTAVSFSNSVVLGRMNGHLLD